MRKLAVAFCALLTVYSAGWVHLARHRPAALIGLDVRYHPLDASLEVTSIVPGGAAGKAGLEPGDRIRSVDGQPLSTYEPFLAMRRAARPGVPIRVAGTRGGRPLALAVVPDQPLGPSPSVTTSLLGRLRLGTVVLQLLTFYPLPFLIVAVTVLLQRPEDGRAWLLAVMLGGFIASAPLPDLEYGIPAGIRGPMFAFWILLFLPLAAVTYAFFGVFPAHSPLDRRVPWLKWAAVGASMAVAVPLAVALWRAGGSEALAWLSDRFPAYQPAAAAVFGLYNFVFFVLAMVSLALNAFGPPDVRRKTRVILFGMLVGTLPLLTLQLAAAVLRVPLERIPFGAWAVSILALFAIPLSLGYAVVKHRAMEIPVLLRRSARGIGA